MHVVEASNSHFAFQATEDVCRVSIIKGDRYLKAERVQIPRFFSRPPIWTWKDSAAYLQLVWKTAQKR